MSPAPSGTDLTSAVFTVSKDQSGALFRLLEPFARHGVNLTAVQSRPIKGKPWEYLFFVDMEGTHPRRPSRARQALRRRREGGALAPSCSGSFPAASLEGRRRRSRPMRRPTAGRAR